MKYPIELLLGVFSGDLSRCSVGRKSSLISSSEYSLVFPCVGSHSPVVPGGGSAGNSLSSISISLSADVGNQPIGSLHRRNMHGRFALLLFAKP